MHGVARLQWTSTERTILLVAWLGWTFDVMDAALFNFAKVPLVKELLGGPEAYAAHGAKVEAGLLMALMLGWSLGGVFFGWLADRWGRVRVMTLTILLYSLFTGLTALCTSLPQLHALRFLAGFGIGGEWAAGAALVAESVSEEKRARAASWLQSAAAFGPWLAAMANYALAGQSWRVLFVVGVLPALLTVFIRMKIKEPVRREFEVTGETPPTRSFLKPAVIGLVLGVAGIASAQNITFWLPNLVTSLSAGLNPQEIQNRQSTATISLHVGTLIGVFLIPYLCTKIGRRLTMLTCFVCGPLAVSAVSALAKTFDTMLLTAPLMSLFGIGLSAAFVLYFPEIFPAKWRATGAGLSYNGGRIIAAAFPFLTAYLIGSQGDVSKSIAQTSVFLGLGAIALIFSPETKGVPLSR